MAAPASKQDDADDAQGAARALAVAPRMLTCATGGDDATVRLWDLRGRRQLTIRLVEAAVTSLAFDEEASSEGQRLAVGYEDGGWEVLRVNLRSDASLAALAAAGLERLHRHRQHDQPGSVPGVGPRRRITDLRFSPDAAYLAVGCADAVVYLYATDDYRLVALCRGHSSAVTHLDWTADSTVLRSNCQGHELRFWDVPSGQQISVASACRDLPWASFGVTLGWHCQGIFRNRADGTGVHSVDRSADGTLLATADDFGAVNLHRYPCVQPQTKLLPSNRREFAGHASAALACRWASSGDAEEEILLSVGGYDLTLFQWRLRRRGGRR